MGGWSARPPVAIMVCYAITTLSHAGEVVVSSPGEMLSGVFKLHFGLASPIQSHARLEQV